MSNNAANIRGRKKTSQKPPVRKTGIVVESYMPCPVKEKVVAEILAKRARRDKEGGQTIGDIIRPAPTG